MAEKKTILVTGGSGLVGHGLRLAMERKPSLKDKDEDWIFLSSKDADLRNPAETKALFEKYSPTHVIHLAARVGGLFDHENNNLEFYRQNTLINDNVLHNCKEFRVKKLVSCSSTCVFPDKTDYPIDETMIHNGPPHDTNFGYAYAKRMLEVQNRAYNEHFGCQFTSIILTNVYGPYDNFHLHKSHVLPGLIHKAYKAKNENTDFTVCGTGTPLRQFIYSLDAGELLVYILRHYPEIDPVLLTVGEDAEVTVKQVAEMVADSINFKGSIVFDTSKLDGQHKKTATNAKLMKYFPDFKFTPLQQGIKETLKWFMENIDIIRK